MVQLSCPHCGWQNREGSRFCAQCGRRLQVGEVEGPGAGLTVVTVLTAVVSALWLQTGLTLQGVAFLIALAGTVASHLRG